MRRDYYSFEYVLNNRAFPFFVLSGLILLRPLFAPDRSVQRTVLGRQATSQKAVPLFGPLPYMALNSSRKVDFPQVKYLSGYKPS